MLLTLDGEEIVELLLVLSVLLNVTNGELLECIGMLFLFDFVFTLVADDVWGLLLFLHLSGELLR